jgi:hypothetical protein
MKMKHAVVGTLALVGSAAVSQSALADGCVVQGAHPYISSHSADPRLYVVGTGLNKYWKDPKVQLCGISSDVDKTWRRLRGGKIRIHHDGDWEMIVKLVQEDNWIPVPTNCLLQVSQKRSYYSRSETACSYQLPDQDWRPLGGQVDATDEPGLTEGDGDYTDFDFGDDPALVPAP